jgi:glutamine amidotransferase-like uncharacterized protein
MRFIFILCILTSVFAANAGASQVLLYNGAGSTTGDVSALTSLLKSLGYSYTLANETQMNVMTRSQFDQYKLILWPGGNSITMGDALTTETTTNIHDAVVLDGVSYLGFCAGAFMAETSTIYNTFKLATTYFNFYNEGAIEMVKISFPSGTSDEVVYWDGPQLSGWGEVVGKYPNGDPAIVQDAVGSNHGFVVLSGVHPEALLDWDVPGYTTSQEAQNNSYAKSLISTTLNKASLSYF